MEDHTHTVSTLEVRSHDCKNRSKTLNVKCCVVFSGVRFCGLKQLGAHIAL